MKLQTLLSKVSVVWDTDLCEYTPLRRFYAWIGFFFLVAGVIEVVRELATLVLK